MEQFVGLAIDLGQDGGFFVRSFKNIDISQRKCYSLHLRVIMEHTVSSNDV
jgi:hypothetical protein